MNRENSNQLYGSSCQREENNLCEDQKKKHLKFADKYPELRKDQMNSIEILKNEYKNFSEKKVLFEAIVEAETVLICLEAPMKEYFAMKEELREIMNETGSDSDESIVKVENPAKDVQMEGKFCISNFFQNRQKLSRIMPAGSLHGFNENCELFYIISVLE